MISFFKGGITTTTSNKYYSNITDIINTIKSVQYKDKCQNIQKAETKEEKNKIKRTLDYITWGGVFQKRNSNQIIKPSGLIFIDIDDNVTPELKEKLKLNKYTYLLYHGPSGKTSLRLIVKIPKTTNNETYKQLYDNISKYFNIKTDNNSKDISRACFLSYDPEPYFDPDSEVFPLELEKPKEKKKNQVISKITKIISKDYKPGNRQYILLNLVGVLRKKGYGIDYITQIVNEICDYNKDSDKTERLNCVNSTFNKNINEIQGISGLKNYLSTATYKEFLNFFGEAENEIFDKYNFFWVKTESGNKYYNINKKGKLAYHKFTITGLVDYIIHDNKDIFERFDISEINRDGNPVPSSEKKKQLSNMLNNYLFENTTLIDDIKYKPGECFLYSEDGENYINNYVPPNITPSNKKEFESITTVMKSITVTDEGYNFFCKWLAYILQNPTAKLPTSFIFMGTQGTGKNLFFDTVIARLFGKRNVITIEQSTIETRWDDYFYQKQIVAADEIHITKRDIVEKLKTITTNPHFSFKIKHKNIVEDRNYSHWLFFTNRNIPFRIDENDRRYTILEQNRPINIDKITKLLENIDDEIYPFQQYLFNLDVKKSEVMKPLMTEEKRQIILNSLPNVKKFIQEIRNYNDLQEFITSYGFFQINIIDETHVSISDFYNIFKTWCNLNNYVALSKNGFSRDLNKYYSIENKPRKINNISLRVYSIEEIMKNPEMI